MRSPLKMTDFMQLTCDARPSTDLEGAMHHMRFFAVSDESHQYEECPDVEASLIFRSERLIEESDERRARRDAKRLSRTEDGRLLIYISQYLEEMRNV